MIYLKTLIYDNISMRQAYLEVFSIISKVYKSNIISTLQCCMHGRKIIVLNTKYKCFKFFYFNYLKKQLNERIDEIIPL